MGLHYSFVLYTNLKFGVKRPRFFLFLPFPRNKTLSGNGMDLERKAQAGMGHSPPDLGPGQLIHFRSQPGKFELKSAICQIDTKYIFIPKCLAPCHPKLLKTIYKSLLDTHFEERVLKCIQCGLIFTWTALSPNPTRREPKRPPTEEPGQKNAMQRKWNH